MIRLTALPLASMILVAGLTVPLALPSGSGGEDWPQYRGRHRDGVTSAGEIPLTWPADGPRVVWKKEAGAGFSQLAVRGGDIYTGVAAGTDEFAVRLDGETGQEVWRTAIGASFEDRFGNGPRATPTLDGDSLYIVSASGELHALRTSDGTRIWSLNLLEKFQSKKPRFGYSPSPLVEGWLLLLEVGGEGGRSLVALDKKSGTVVWTVLSGPAGYSSPVVADMAGERQVVLPRGRTLTGLSLAGVILWEYQMEEPAIAMPVVVKGDRIFVSSNGDTGCALVKVFRTEKGLAVKEEWRNRNMRNHFNSSLLIGDAIYGFDNATLKCLDLESGDVKWAKRGFGKGSLIGVDDRLLVLSVKGNLVMVEANPEAYHELGSYHALEGKSWTAPSYVGGRVYLRNLTQMACLDLRR
ncbi:MAG: PQQ-like beta-propeller repeat protein [Acidobacteria bacterium]|nr:PQQ-like beta-propeller repeat protein [Acidobacteriota bacterium]